MPDRPHAAAYIAASVDGFIARPDGGLDWLPTPTGDEDYGYHAFVASVDTLVLGRKTYEMVRGFGEWPYDAFRVVVLSSGTPDTSGVDVEVLALAPGALLDHLGATGARGVWVDGGQTLQRFIRAGCLDELIVTRVPVLLGDGVPLFGPLSADVPLQHVETQAFDDGMVQSRYRLS
ncbi:dihydrofolate reductase family protein [Rubrivirga sp. IMCC43871]|uniref:dihydrofolate reductase family protein n=1 Tax=Rubrivirga sp. IMCC43871 TaxID=3391575 RepID=UPI00399006DA